MKYAAEAGLPQGDPLSMMAAAIVMKPWAAMMREDGMTPYLFVDDILLMGREEQEIQKFKMAMNKTLQCFTKVGAAISPGRSHLFAKQTGKR